MSFRKEKKFKLTFSDFDFLKNQLIENGMKMLYQSRVINSLYYDTELKDMFYHSEEGVLPRKKVRLRWYKDPKDSNIEVKTSSIEGRFKTTNSLNKNFLNEFPDFLMDSMYGVLTPSLLVSYEREYYLLENMRITFDRSITYTNFRLPFRSSYEDPERVMEIKVSIDTEDDFIEKYIPYATSRFSKYSRGLLFSQQELK
ncbi:VTC domain-containing protein [Gammaproteobacteria bacterium]|nr:VTC domain-containing protein [Gammaproteobacteria bacterium]